MGVLGSVVQALVLAVFDTRHDFLFGSAIALQLVGNQHPRRAALFLQELFHQPLGRLLVAPALDENVEHHAMLINGAPKPVFPPLDPDHHLVEVPLGRQPLAVDGAGSWQTADQTSGPIGARFHG